MENLDLKNRPPASATVIRFGPFEVNRVTREVRKYGIRLKLSGQPLEVLLFLLERSGELVSRVELQQRLWPEDVFVDFERSLNSAVKKLRGSLSDNPETPRYIETLPRQGYRFIGEINEMSAKPVPVGASVGVVQEPVTSPVFSPVEPNTVPGVAQHTFSRWIAAIIVLAIASGGLLLVARRQVPFVSMSAPAAKRPNVRAAIAILGFKNLSFQHEGDWLGTAVSQMLATELQSGDQLRIIPQEAVSRAKTDLNLKEKDGYPRDTLRELNKTLSSDYVVAGSYVAMGDRESGQIRLDMRLQETISGETLAGIAVSGKQSEIFDLVRTGARELKAKVGGTMGPEGDADWRAVIPANSEAATLYTEGFEKMRAGDNVSARRLWEQSAAIEPQFALTGTALADAWQALGYDDRAQASAQKAMSQAASLPENVRIKVEGQYFESRHDWAGAIPAYRHLFRDYPDDLEVGLKLASTEISAGQLDDAASTISSLRSMESAYRKDPRIELAEALLASRHSDFKAQQELAQDAGKKAAASGSLLLLARAKMLEGWAMDDQSQISGALEAYRIAQPIFEKAGDIDNTATALDDIGIVLEKQGDLKSAREKLEEAQKLFRQIGDENGLGASLTNLGELEHGQGDLATAEDLYREAIALFRKASRKENECSALNNLGGVLFERGEFREAKNTYENVLRLRQEAGDKDGVGNAKANLAAAYWVSGDLEKSAALLNEALRTFRDVGDRGSMASVETAYSRVLILKNDFASARRALSDALKITEEIGAKGDSASARILLAKVTVSEGHAEQVNETTLQSSIDDLRAEHRGGDEMEALTVEIQAFIANGNLDLARENLLRAKALHNATWLSNYHLMLASAQIDAAEGRHELSRREIAAARAKAEKVGCGACQLESASAPLQIGKS